MKIGTGARAVTANEAARNGEIVIVTIPQRAGVSEDPTRRYTVRCNVMKRRYEIQTTEPVKGIAESRGACQNHRQLLRHGTLGCALSKPDNQLAYVSPSRRFRSLSAKGLGL